MVIIILMLAPCYSVIIWYMIYDWIQINACGFGGKKGNIMWGLAG